MKLSAILEPLIAAGVSGDVLLATVRAFEDQREDALEKRRKSDRARQATKRELDALSRESRDPSTVTRDSSLMRDRVAPVEDNSSNKQEKEERKKDSAAKPRGDLEAFRRELSPILSPERIDALIAVRRKKGATFSAHAGSLLLAALQACPDPSAAADEMVLRNWTGIKPEWLESRAAPQQRATAPPAETVGSLSKRQLFEQRQTSNAPDDTTGRVVQIESRRLEDGPGSPRSFALPSNLLGRI